MAVIEKPDLDAMHILVYPDPELRVNARPIGEPQDPVPEIAERMKDLMQQATGIGLAATQVGLAHRLVVVCPTADPLKIEAYIDPVIVKRDGRTSEEEGCLSVPGVQAKVRRANKVLVRATRLDGTVMEMEAEGLAARMWQHEIDHLDGGLFVDKVGPASRILIRRQLKQLERDFESHPGYHLGGQPDRGVRL